MSTSSFQGYPKGCAKMELKHSMVQNTRSYTRQCNSYHVRFLFGFTLPGYATGYSHRFQWRIQELGGGGGHRRGCGKGWDEVVGGAGPGRVREGGTPPAQLGGVGERCKLPHRGLGRSPRSQRFLRRKPPKKYVKTALKM